VVVLARHGNLTPAATDATPVANSRPETAENNARGPLSAQSLLDTIDGCFMNFAYGWAFSKPVRQGLTTTSPSPGCPWPLPC